MTYQNIEEFIRVKFGSVQAYVFLMKIKELLPIYYVAVRGRDNAQGAVQRVLSRRRISSIQEYVLEGNVFYSPFILNWVDENYKIEFIDRTIRIPQVSNGAQVIDGQHRLEGLRRAYDIKPEIGEQSIIVILTQNLTTEEAARIFLNINTEQKPVPKSLVYDLFGEVKDKNFYIVRAQDIANLLHSDIESPYYQCIRLAGAGPGMGKVDSSTIVSALKQFTIPGGAFSNYNLTDFESQYKVVSNFFTVLEYYYDLEGNWLKARNPFMANSGCFAGIEFLCKDLIPKCAERRSFEITTMKDLLDLSEGLLYKDELKNIQGKEQRNIVYTFLKSSLLKDVPNQDEYKF